MGSYIITIDSGTTNTRAFLWNDDRRVVARAKREVGVRNTAIDGNNRKLREGVKDCIHEVLSKSGLGESDLKSVLASGMISSNVGLVEIPHCVAPVGIGDLAAAAKQVSLPEVCSVPITFIPGVKNAVETVDLTNFESMDIMRGEEVESAALMEIFSQGREYLFLLPGSHMKFVSVNAGGKITGCLTSISGELLSCITNDTIIADAVNRKFASAETYDRQMVLLGYETARKTGIGRACFSARILSQFSGQSSEMLSNYILGVALQSDVTSIRNSGALTVGPQTEVVIAGNMPVQQAISDILEYDGYFRNVHAYVPQSDIPLSALGAWTIMNAH